MRAPSPYLENGWTHCAEIWYVGRDPLARRVTRHGWRAYICTCAISGCAGRILLKHGVLLNPLTMHFTHPQVQDIRMRVSVQLHILFKDTSSLPFARRPKDELLVLRYYVVYERFSRNEYKRWKMGKCALLHLILGAL